MEPELEATLRDIEIEAKYQDTVYEQTVVLDIDGDTIEVFDGRTVASKDSIGESDSFIILIDPKEDGIEVINEEKTGITEPRKPISKWSYEFYGKILCKNGEDEWFESQHENLLLLDIGVGTVLLNPTEEIIELANSGELEKGDYLHVSGGRTDLVSSTQDS